MEFDKHRGYFYGVLLGDGHINYTPRAIESGNSAKDRYRGPMMMLKVCDRDFIDAWRDCIKAIIGKEYAISKHSPGQGTGARRQQWKLRVTNRAFVDEAESVTAHKTKIPDAIVSGSRETQVAFAQGLMDSEGWINLAFGGGRGQCDLTLGFGCGDPWLDDFYQLVHSLGIETSKIYTRKPTIKKNGEEGGTLRLFKIDIPSYMNAGLSFTIARKRDRLLFCSRILNDYTREYPRYEDYYREEDIVWPAAKVAD